MKRKNIEIILHSIVALAECQNIFDMRYGHIWILYSAPWVGEIMPIFLCMNFSWENLDLFRLRKWIWVSFFIQIGFDIFHFLAILKNCPVTAGKIVRIFATSSRITQHDRNTNLKINHSPHLGENLLKDFEGCHRQKA